MSATTIDIPGYKPGTWVMDPSHSEVGFSVRHMMISKVRGAFGVKSATIIAPENRLEVTVVAQVDATSLDTLREGVARIQEFVHARERGQGSPAR